MVTTEALTPARMNPWPRSCTATDGLPSVAGMPDALCPHCETATPREQWQAHPPGSFPFAIRCPACGIVSDSDAVVVSLHVTAPRRPPPSR